jgi:6-phosphogluconolactonase
MLKRAVIHSLLVCLVSSIWATTARSDTVNVYIGTYTSGESKGIYRATFDTDTGELSAAVLVAETDDPSFLAIHPNGKFLYAVNETDDRRGLDKKPSGGVSSFAIEETGKLKFLNEQPSHGAAPCHLVTDKAGRFLYVANYTGGNVAVFAIENDGRLSQILQVIQHRGTGKNKKRQAGPHAHSINLDASGKFAMAADLGIDSIAIYSVDSESGKLKTSGGARLAAGSGPRHFAFHPTKNFAYVINELNLTITAFDFDPDTGQLIDIQTQSTIPNEEPGPGKSTAEIVVHPNGKFVYGSNRGPDSIAVFSIDQETGKLTHVENESTQGKTPRNFAIAPGGKYLLAENQGSNTIVVFSIDQDTGALNATGNKIEVPSPVCIRFHE